jgi:predicted LPLAT superfamily acyltransferase
MNDHPVTKNNRGDSGGPAQPSWYAIRESGSRWGLRFFLWILKALGYRAARSLAYLISLYFFVFQSSVRKHCAEFHRRVLGRSSLFLAYRAIVNFSITVVDRAYIQMGRASYFSMTIHGEDVLRRIKATRDEGAIVLGSHLGSIEVGPALSKRLGVSVGMLMYHQRSSMLYQELERINPDIFRGIIEMKKDSLGYILEVRERYEKGDLIGILGDRTWKTGPTLRLPFFGVDKNFPIGAYHIASILKAPIIFMVIVKGGLKEFHCYIEELASAADAESKSRDRFTEEVLKKYVSRLEEYCRRFPLHWFNYYDFWNE